MDCQGGLWLDHIEFRGGFDFHGTEVHGRTWLKGAQDGRQATYGAERAIAEKLSSHGYTYST